jgi:uncharacterized RDD family membrane protein YckC
LAAASFLLWLAATSAAAAEDWRPARLWAATSGKTIWVVGASKSEPGRFATIRMWTGETEPHHVTPRPRWHLPPISGDILSIGADREALHVLFSDLSVRDYLADRGGSVGPRWRDVSIEAPLAWGGDSSRSVFWALARTSRLARTSTRPATQAADNDETHLLSPPLHSTLTVVEMRDGLWRALGAPESADAAERFWLTGRQGEAWLFWQADGHVWASSRPAAAGIVKSRLGPESPDQDEDAKGQPEPAAAKPSSSQPTTAEVERPKTQFSAAVGVWTPPESVCETDDLLAAWAGEGPNGPVFVAGRGAKEGRVRLCFYLREGGDWLANGVARDGTEILEVDSRISGVCVAAGRLLVVRPTQDEGLELGLGDLGPSPSVRFSPLTLSTTEAPESSPWRDGIFFAVILVVMTVVMWTRREQMTRPLPLPAGLVLAPVTRRLLATIVDALPAAVVALSLIVSIIPSTAWPLDASPWTGLNVDPETADRLFNVYYGFVLLYGLWCLLWELLLGTTPGKLVFGCRVLTTDINRPSARQIIWRNALRVVEVGMGASGWIVTLMMLVMLTRNRQRIGDLLAGTIVVTLGPPQPDQPAGQDDGHQPPSAS